MVEGGTLLRCYTSKRGIEGSNPSSSAPEIAFLQDNRGSKEEVRGFFWSRLHQLVHQRGPEGPFLGQGFSIATV